MTTHDPHPQPPAPWRRTLASLLLVGVTALGLAPDATAGPRAKMDRHLRERAGRAADATPFKVIVTLKKGAKRDFVKALRASGYQVGADFTLTEAFAAQLPAGLLRALENDPDVEAISTDAPVTSMATVGTVYTVTNTSNTGAGSLRQAITDANAHAGADTINFNIAGTGVHTITPTSALPAITGPVDPRRHHRRQLRRQRQPAGDRPRRQWPGRRRAWCSVSTADGSTHPRPGDPRFRHDHGT